MYNMITILFLTAILYAETPEPVIVKHKYYKASFDTVKHYPVYVEWWVTKAMLSCGNRIERKSSFYKDPQLGAHTNLAKDYEGSGYDRGHNMPAFDNQCDSIGNRESFYYTNITPQSYILNRGDWNDLEDYTRDTVLKYDSVKVMCGSFGEIKKYNRLSIPRYCWKVLYIKKARRYESFLFDNDSKVSKDLLLYRTTKANITKLSGYKINSR